MFTQSGEMIKRCVTCGSKNHVHKECTRAGGGADAERDAHWAAYRQRKAEAPAQQQTGDGGKGKGKGKDRKGKGGDKGGGRKGGPAAAAAAAAAASAESTTPSTAVASTIVAKVPIHPRSRRSAHLADVPVRRSMLDSGANARVTYVKQLDKSQGVGSVTLASGESAPCSTFIGFKGMPNVQIVGSSDADILPLCWLIERHCKMADNFMTMQTPKGRLLQIQRGEDELLYLEEPDVADLLQDLPDAEFEGRSGDKACKMANLAFSMRLRVAALKIDAGAGVTHVGHEAGISAKPASAHILPQDSPPPAAVYALTQEQRQMRQERLRSLRRIFDEKCRYSNLHGSNLNKKIDKYKAMPDEYHDWHEDNYMSIEKIGDLHEMSCISLQAGVASKFWEWMAGSGRLSATARRDGITHLPPLDYRWGVNLGHWWHQLTLLWTFFVYPVDVLFAAPTCTPWSSNSRQWSEKERQTQRSQEGLTLQFLTIVFLIQSLMGRAWILEQPAGSDMFRKSALRYLTGADPIQENFKYVFDQCMLGANSDGVPAKKKSEMRSNQAFTTQPPQCDGQHVHCILRGSDSGGSRTAQAAVYPPQLCNLILEEASNMSAKIQSGGRTAEIHLHRLRDVAHHQHTLQKILPEVRLLAEHQGQETLNVFDALVIPWARVALGGELTRLRYDVDLSEMQILSLPHVHGGKKSMNKIGFNTKETSGAHEQQPLGLHLQGGGGDPARLPHHPPEAGACHVKFVGKAAAEAATTGAFEQIQKDLAAISGQLKEIQEQKASGKVAAQILQTTSEDGDGHFDSAEGWSPSFVANQFVQVGGSSGSSGAAPSDWRNASLEQPPSRAPLPPRDLREEEHQFPLQVGDGLSEGQHLQPVVLSDCIKGELEKEPWQFQPYKAGDATWLHAAQRRHAHRRRSNFTVGVASVDLSGPHVATPTPGTRIGTSGGRYFVVMVVRPDLNGGRRDAGCQAVEAGDAQEGHVADDRGAQNEGEEQGPAEEVQSYQPHNPLIYVEIIEFKHQASQAIMKMIALMREELGGFPSSLPESWTVHRLHSDKGGELLPRSLDDYCAQKGIRRTTTQGYDPSANGAAEQAVGFIKRKARFLLAGARLSSTWWGVAAKTAAIYSRCDVGLLSWPRIPFGTRIMAVRDPSYRDAFAARSHPAVAFGPSESVPGGYVIYADGRLKDMTNIAVTDLEPHDLTWVKANLDNWQEPAGVQQPLRPEAWDPLHAGDPSVHVPRVRRPPPAEAAAPEEQEVQQAMDLPGDAPGDFWLEPFDAQEEERIYVAQEQEEERVFRIAAASGKTRCLQPVTRVPKASRRRKRDKEFQAALAQQGGFQAGSPYALWCPHIVCTSIASDSIALVDDPTGGSQQVDVHNADEFPEPPLDAADVADASDPPPSPTLSPLSYDQLSFSDFEDEFVVGAFAGPGEYFDVGNQGAEVDEKTEVVNLPGDACSPAPPTIEDDSDDEPRDPQRDASTGGAGGAPKPQRGSKPQRGKAKHNRGRRCHVQREGGKKKPSPRTDSLPRSRLRMNVSPAHLAFRSFAANSIAATSVVSPGGEQLVSTLEEPEELEPGSRIVSEAEIRAATGATRDAWHAAAHKEYKESFMDMNAVARATPSDIARAGGRSKALPMKVVWTQKPEKKKCRAVVCGNFEERDPTEQVWTAQAETSSVMAGLRLSQLQQWHVGKLDVKGAFMYAPLPDGMHILCRPPKSWVRLGLVEEDDLWVLRKAVYGLRIAPRAWGTERDSKLRDVTWTSKGATYKLIQCKTDSQVWRIVSVKSGATHVEHEAKTLGLLICYVDDLLLLSPKGPMRDGLTAAVKKIWEVTEVDLIQGVPFAFLGIEIDRRANGDLKIHQSAFTKQLLGNYGFDTMTRSCHNVQMGLPAEDDEPPDAEKLKILQKYCGEFNWLATRTRPDISYFISVIAQAITKYAAWSFQFCKKVIRYLATTWDQGIIFPWITHVATAGLISWSDASFAGVSTRSQTGVIVIWEGAVVLWRSSRQTSSALSTCEAEVAAAATSWQITEGLKALLDEWGADVGKPILLVDNKSALKVSELGGTWRTRYFAVRAARLQEESAADRISLRYCPTDDMMGDGLTKAASGQVLAKLRDCCHGKLPRIPGIDQSFKDCEDKATWWGKGLEANYIRVSVAKVFSKPVPTTCRTLAENTRQSVAASASTSSPPPPPQPQTPAAPDPQLALELAMTMMKLMKSAGPGQ